MQISPDGKYVAFVVGQAVYSTNSYRSGLFVVGTAKGSKPTCLGTAGPPHWDRFGQWASDAPQWSADSQYIYYRLDTSGTWQVWRWNLEGGAPIRLTRVEYDVTSFGLSPDRTQLIFIANKVFNQGTLKQLAEHGVLYDGSVRAWRARPILNELTDETKGNTETWIHELESGNERKANQEELNRYGTWKSDLDGKVPSQKQTKKHQVLSAKISPDGKSVAYQLYLEDPSESFRHSFPLFSKPVLGGTSVALTPGAYNIEQYWWSPDSKEIYYAEDADNGYPFKLMAISAKGGAPRERLTSTEFLTEFSADRTSRFLACVRQNSITPPQVSLADTSTGEVRVLVDVNPEFQNYVLSPAKRIEVTTDTGDAFFGNLVLPHNYQPGKRYPLIITTYKSRGGFLRGALGDEYPIQVFAANGFAVLDFDVGHGRNFKPGDFDTAILQWQSPIAGIEAAIGKLTAMGIVDPTKIGITGASHGAEIVEYAISHTDLFHAAIESGPGGKDPLFFYLGGKVWHDTFVDLGLPGWPEGKSSGKWAKLSPALNADHVHAALLSNAADTEYVAGLQWITSLEQLEKPVELFVYPNEIHIKNQPKHRFEIYERNIDWLKFWLENEEDSDPAKAEQYKRWRELRKLQEKNEATRTGVPRQPTEAGYNGRLVSGNLLGQLCRRAGGRVLPGRPERCVAAAVWHRGSGDDCGRGNSGAGYSLY